MLRRNVLIFQTGGLGDFVLTWPFAVGMARIYPQSRIIYVTHQQRGELARRVLRLESTDIETGWHGLFAEDGKLPAAAQRSIETSHTICTFLPVTPTWHLNLERINPLARRIEIDTRIAPDFFGHLTDKIVADLETHPPEKSALQQMLRSITDRGIGFKPTGGVDVVIHPGSGSPKKCWPLDRYLALAGKLKQAGRSVRLITGEVEREKWSAADRQKLKATGSARDCDSCLDLLDEIKTAGWFIGNDSGPAHLAGMIGIPTVALFGPTNPSQWKPLGPQVKVLQHQPLADLSVEVVFNALSGLNGHTEPAVSTAIEDDD
jgi:heptosyltransferase-3